MEQGQSLDENQLSQQQYDFSLAQAGQLLPPAWPNQMMAYGLPQMMGFLPPGGPIQQPESTESAPDHQVAMMQQAQMPQPTARTRQSAATGEGDESGQGFSGRPNKNLHITREAHEALKGLRISNCSMGEKLRLLLDFFDKTEQPPEIINPKIQSIKQIIQGSTRIWLKLKIHEDTWQRLNFVRDKYSCTNSEAVYLLVDFHEAPQIPQLTVRPQASTEISLQQFAQSASAASSGQSLGMQFPFFNMPWASSFMNFPFFPGMPRPDGQMFPDGTPAQPDMSGLDSSAAAAAAALSAQGVPSFFGMDPTKLQEQQQAQLEAVSGQLPQESAAPTNTDEEPPSKRQRSEPPLSHMALVEIDQLKRAFQSLRCGQCNDATLTITESSSGAQGGDQSHAFLVSCSACGHSFQF